MPKKITDIGKIFVSESTNTVEIHVPGDMLPCSAFTQILEIMKKHFHKKEIVFNVYNAKMMLMIRESLPSEYYERIELHNPKSLELQGGLKRAG